MYAEDQEVTAQEATEKIKNLDEIKSRSKISLPLAF
jgi:hypothetical protein